MSSRAFQDVPDKEVELLNQIKESPAISRAKLAEALNISERQVRKITERLKEKRGGREGGDSGKWLIQHA